jgi:2-polyprenyl-3-methyl-5-hydroxy-6-metoxy-1,4-benzoquinol methylase
MARRWTNRAAIERWAAMPREEMERMDAEGDFAKRHLVNPALLRMLGDVAGRRVLDAGCGQGYLSRMLAARGARVVGVEPAQALFDYSVEREVELGQGIGYVQADLCDLPDLGEPFDACVASMVLIDIPDWEAALAACVERLRPGATIVVTLNHPCFERLWTVWREHGEYRLSRYLADYDIEGRHGVSFHRPLSAYLNRLIGLGCRIREVAEPGLSEAAAADGPEGIEAYVHLPNFILIAAERS